MSLVVLVDDEEAVCSVLGRVLRFSGAEVRTFTDPHEALAFIDEQKPDLVLCDYRMPGLNGVELFGRLKVDVPFVLMSGDLSVGDVSETGIFEVLTKPFETKALLELVKSHLDGHSS